MARPCFAIWKMAKKKNKKKKKNRKKNKKMKKKRKMNRNMIQDVCVSMGAHTRGGEAGPFLLFEI